jgi:hypothetical protein
MPNSLIGASTAVSSSGDPKKESLGAKTPIIKTAMGIPMKYAHIYTFESIRFPLVV